MKYLYLVLSSCFQSIQIHEGDHDNKIFFQISKFEHSCQKVSSVAPLLLLVFLFCTMLKVDLNFDENSL
jgi:hypothetical protein